MIRHSLRIRLMATFMIIMMVVIVVVTILERQIAISAFQSTLSEQTTNDKHLFAQLWTVYQQTSNSSFVQDQIDHVAKAEHTRIVLIDHQQRVIADSKHELTGRILSFSELFTSNTFDYSSATLDQSVIPTAPTRFISTDNINHSIGPLPLTALPDSLKDVFTATVNSTLGLAVSVAGVVALLLTIFLSSSIVRPIQALTQAAHRMEQGDLKQRVKVKTNDEIGTLAHAFNTMADSVARSEELRQNLVSDVAHELRTPLTNIRGYLEAIQDQVVEATPVIIASLYEEALLLTRLSKDLQDLTLAEAGRLTLLCVPVALEDIIYRAANGLYLQIVNKKLSLHIDIAPNLPLVEADTERVGQILRNLLNNAIAYTPANGMIMIRVRPVHQEVEVAVQDTGVGIEREHLPYLFKRFYRTDRSRTRSTGGTGLGLAIVEQLVHAHGGQVTVQSQPGQGTCFTFTLPINRWKESQQRY